MSAPTPRELREQRSRARQMAEAKRMRQHRMEFSYASQHRCSLEEANHALRKLAARAAEAAIEQRKSAGPVKVLRSAAPAPTWRPWWID